MGTETVSVGKKISDMKALLRGCDTLAEFFEMDALFAIDFRDQF